MFIKKNLETLVLQDGTHSVMATPPVIANALKNNRNSAATHFSKENIGSYYSSWVISKLSPWKKIVNDHIGLIQQVTSLTIIAQNTVGFLFLGWHRSKIS